MNTFYLSKNPVLAAIWQPDKLVVKMPTETAQLLATRFPKADLRKVDGTPYQSIPQGKDIQEWLNVCPANVLWLLRHGQELCYEYERRYGREHGALQAINQCTMWYNGSLLIQVHQYEKHTPPPKRMPEQYKKEGDVAACYRAYFKAEKLVNATFTGRKVPPIWQGYVYEQPRVVLPVLRRRTVTEGV